MLIRKAHIYRLRRVSPAASQRMTQWAGCVRKIWNKALYLQYESLETTGKIISYPKLNKMLTGWKREPELAFLNDCYSQSLQQTLRNLKEAWDRCFDPALAAQRPVPKKKFKSRKSFCVPQHFEIDQPGSRVFLPKLGWFHYYNSRKIEGTPKNITVFEKCDEWYISVQVEMDVEAKSHPSREVTGVDLGTTKLIALSDGTYQGGIGGLFRASERKLTKAQRSLARKTKFSNNWRKAKAKVALIYNHIANIRKDFLHKLTSKLCNNHAVLFFEDLEVQSMTTSARGTIENPGVNVTSKSKLNKSILEQSWGEIRRQCAYKQSWLSGLFLKVTTAFSSQRCFGCCHVDAGNRVDQARFHCVSCGHKQNADINAAQNHLEAGLRLLCLWKEALRLPMQQKPSSFLLEVGIPVL